METQAFLAPSALQLYLAGYPGLPGRRLVLRNVQSGEDTELRPAATPGDEWRLTSLPVPPSWVGKPVQLIAEDTVTGGLGWLAFSLPFLPPSSRVEPVIDTTQPQKGFCSDGVHPSTQWPGGRPHGLITWGSYCASRDAGTGWTASHTINAGSYLHTYLAGYPSKPGLRLAVENVQTRQQLLLQIPEVPAETWRRYHFRLPDAWRGQPVRIIAGDQATGSQGWVAFSEPASTEARIPAVRATITLGYVLVLGIVLLAPCAAVSMVAASRGMKDLLDLTTIAFLVLGFTGWAIFWIYFCSKIAGLLFSYGGFLASCAVIVVLLKKHRTALAPAKQLIGPTMLVFLATVFVVSLGLLYSGNARPLSMPSGRFAPIILAADNEIPKIFADGVYTHHIPRPLMADWLSSDRPPLQAGNTLWIYGWAPGDRELPYLAVSVLLQCSFLAALWALLMACHVDRKALVLTMAACLFPGFTLLNSFFTWPKLYPVAFLLIIVSYLFTDRYDQIRSRLTFGAAVGAAIAFAMLCHGGSVIAIAGIAVCMLLTGRYPHRRFLTGMAVTCLALYLPWMLYQKFYDPPGDRLLKWHIGGSVEPRPNDSFAKVLLENYGKRSASQLIELKASNFRTLAGDLPQFFGDAREFSVNLFSAPAGARARARLIRYVMFIHWIPGIGFAMLGPVALLLSCLQRNRGPEYRTALRFWLLTGLSLVLWCLILFGPAATVPHQGTYFTEILAFTGSTLALWALSRWVSVALTTLQIGWNAALYIWATAPPPAPGMGTESGPLNLFLAAACCMSAAAIFVLLARFALRPAQAAQAAAVAAGTAVDEKLGLKSVLQALTPNAAFRGGDHIVIVAGVAIAAYVVATTLIFVRKCYVPIPTSDQWDEWRALLQLKSYGSHLFAQHNEHRIAFARLFFSIDQFVFHARNSFLLVCSFLIQVITAVFLWRLATRPGTFSRTASIVLACFIASCLFSAQQLNNFIWGFQVQFVAVYCTAVAAIWALLRTAEAADNASVRGRDHAWLATSCVLGVLSTYSMSNGLAVWPLLLLTAFWLRLPVRHRLVLGAATLIMSAAYLWGYHSPGHHAQPLDSLLHHLPRALAYAAVFIGSPADMPAAELMRFAGVPSDDAHSALCAMFGATGVIAAFICLAVLWRRRDTRPAHIALFSILLFVMGTAFLVGLGRLNFPLHDALLSRYATPAMIFWAALVALVWNLAGPEQVQSRDGVRRIVYGTVLLSMAWGIALKQRHWIEFSNAYAATMADLESVVVSGVDDEDVLRQDYHTPAALIPVFDYLKQKHLSIFTEDWTHWPGTQLSAHFTPDNKESCAGAVDGVNIIPSAIRPAVKVNGWAWDKKGGHPPRMVILADHSGRIVGVTHDIIDRPDVPAALTFVKSAQVGWRGYAVPAGAEQVTAYVLESDGKSVCPIGAVPNSAPIREAAFTDLLAAIQAPVAVEGAWTKQNGYHRDAGPPPFDGPVYGSYAGNDANTGTLRLGPFQVERQLAIAVPVVTGPSNGGLLLKVENAKTGEVIAALAPPPVRQRWWAWRVTLPRSQRSLSVNILAEDSGRAFGEWEAIGMPHLLKDNTLASVASLNGSVQEVPLAALGTALEMGSPAIEGSWTRDGYYPDAGRLPVEGPAYASWAGSDAHVGTIRMGPFTLQHQQSIAIPLVSGASTVGMLVKVMDVDRGEIVALLDPPPVHSTWWAWKVTLPQDRPQVKLLLRAEDRGSGPGQWQGIGVPHLLK